MADRDRVRWDERYRRRPTTSSMAPEPFLIEVGGSLPRRGRALDVAGGVGDNSTWLAGRGLAVTLADISPVAVCEARRRADEASLQIRTVAVDLEETPCPVGPWDLIVCIRFLHRPLWRQFVHLVGPGGTLVVVHPTVRNLERFERPSRRFLLAEGELLGLLAGWRIDHHEEDWGPGPMGRHEVRCLARRPGAVV